ncbi:MAG TPA: ClbS/DfsB family four-helix bundle protein [Thermomicrobiales bacterium]|nr:ClbS/DfsB family four-helix bundle protein [Thermomicrobiales bacterium]
MQELNSREALLETVRGLREEMEQVVAEVDEARANEPGSFDEWSFKDLIAHLNGWRSVTAARLEAGLRGEEPVFPWPGNLSEEQDVDAVNRWFHEDSKPKSFDEVLRDQQETFERVEQAIAALPEDDLLGSGRFPWLHWTSEGLGPAVVRGTYGHYHEDHEPELRAWLSTW